MANENEHLEKSYELWKRFRFIILTVIAMIGALIFGISWQNATFQETRNAVNTHLFQSMEAGDNFATAQALEHYQALDDYKEFPEVKNLAAFALARAAVGDDAAIEPAENALKEVITDSEDGGIQKMAVLRLAELYLRQDKTQEAIELLNLNKPEKKNIFSIMFNERLGDAYFLQVDHNQAQLSYTQALISSQTLATYYLPIIRAKMGILFSESLAKADG